MTLRRVARSGEEGDELARSPEGEQASGRRSRAGEFRKIPGVAGKTVASARTGCGDIVNNYLGRQVVMRMLIRRRYVRRVARMVVGVRSGMVLMLGLRRERLGRRRRRCPRPVVRPVAFIGAIHLHGRMSSTRPEESLPPSTHGDTKVSDTDMATLIPGRAGDALDSDQSFGEMLSASPPRPRIDRPSFALPPLAPAFFFAPFPRGRC